MKRINNKAAGAEGLPCSEYSMITLPVRRLFGGLALAALGLAALPARADIIAGDGFNYIPSGANLDGANGGTVLPPTSVGWATPWSGDATAVVGSGLSYSGYTPSLGIGNSVTLGANVGLTLIDPVGISRQLGDSSGAGNTLWMRMLYNPGVHVEESRNVATPFQLAAANNGFLNLQRDVGAGGGALNEVYSLNMSGYNSGSTPFDFTGSGSGTTYMLLFRLDINQTDGQNETLSMWLNPTSLTAEGLPITPTATVSANILQSGDDFLQLFSANGYGDTIDELVIGTTFADAIGQLTDPVTSVPEVSGTVMMAMVGFLGGGVVWYRRRQKAVA